MNALSEALSGLASYAPYILIGLAVVVVLLVLLLVVLAFRARGRARKKAQQDAAQAAAPPVTQDGEPAPQDGVPAGALGEEPEPRRRMIFTGLRAPIGRAGLLWARGRGLPQGRLHLERKGRLFGRRLGRRIRS